MARHVWQFGLVILLCCVFIVALAIFSATEAAFATIDNIHIPVIFNKSPAKEPVFQGALEPEDLIINSLAMETADRWTLDLFAGDMISITVAPGNSADIMLSLFDSDGLILVNQQNLSPAGAVETFSDVSIAKAGVHDLMVQTVQGEPTEYALMFMDEESYSFVFRGTLLDNDSRQDFLPADVDHFWFFNALGGESVSFTITPDDSGDAYVELYDPSGSRMLTIDDTAEGEPESLETYTLLESGLYSIRVAEFDFRTMDYRLDFSKP